MMEITYCLRAANVSGLNAELGTGEQYPIEDLLFSEQKVRCIERGVSQPAADYIRLKAEALQEVMVAIKTNGDTRIIMSCKELASGETMIKAVRNVS